MEIELFWGLIFSKFHRLRANHSSQMKSWGCWLKFIVVLKIPPINSRNSMPGQCPEPDSGASLNCLCIPCNPSSCSLGLMDLHTSLLWRTKEKMREREKEREREFCPQSWTILATVSAHIRVSREGLSMFSPNKIFREKIEEVFYKQLIDNDFFTL